MQDTVVWDSARTQVSTCGKKAKIGLWAYCIEEDVPWFPDGAGAVEGAAVSHARRAIYYAWVALLLVPRINARGQNMHNTCNFPPLAETCGNLMTSSFGCIAGAGGVDVCVKYGDLISVTGYATKTTKAPAVVPASSDVGAGAGAGAGGDRRHRRLPLLEAELGVPHEGPHKRQRREGDDDDSYDSYDDGSYDEVPAGDGSGQVDDTAAPRAAAAPRDGNARFDSVSAKKFRSWTAFAIIGASVSAMIADIFSEKVYLGTFLCLASTAGGIISTVIWGIFQSEISAVVTGKVAMSYGAAICIVAWMIALMSTIGYGMNSARVCGTEESREDEDETDA